MTQERHNFRSPYIERMLSVSRRVPIEFQEPEDLPHLVQQFRLGIGQDERSLCHLSFRSPDGRQLLIYRTIRNGIRFVARMGKTVFSLPNTC